MKFRDLEVIDIGLYDDFVWAVELSLEKLFDKTEIWDPYGRWIRIWKPIVGATFRTRQEARDYKKKLEADRFYMGVKFRVKRWEREL